MSLHTMHFDLLICVLSCFVNLETRSASCSAGENASLRLAAPSAIPSSRRFHRRPVLFSA